jgi:hypothetical protein
LCALDVHRGTTDWLPDLVGFAMAALGAMAVARHLPRKSARVAPVAFLLAALAEGAATAGIAPAVSVSLAGLFAAVGVFALPWLADRRIVRPVFWLAYGVPVALIWLTLGWVLLSGEPVSLGGDLVRIALFVSGAGALWAVGHLILAGRRRGVPRTE